jgi:hypothetical protein
MNFSEAIQARGIDERAAIRSLNAQLSAARRATPTVLCVCQYGPWHGQHLRLPKGGSSMLFSVGQYTGRYHQASSVKGVAIWEEKL